MLSQKPWLEGIPLKSKKLENIKLIYPLEKPGEKIDFRELTGPEFDSWVAEITYIKKVVHAKKHVMREKKSDKELLEDARFFNRHCEYIRAMIKNRNDFSRLGIEEDKVANLTKGEVKKHFHKMALLWHPDSIKKSHKFCFANEEAYQNLVSESF